MTSDEINDYVGLPWVSGGVGPDAFDCWGLLSWIQRHHFGLILPSLPDLVDARRALYQHQIDSGAWQVRPMPVHGCGALLRGGDRPHVGVFLAVDGGGVLHAQEGDGVVFTARSNLKRMGYPRAAWYRFE